MPSSAVSPPPPKPPPLLFVDHFVSSFVHAPNDDYLRCVCCCVFAPRRRRRPPQHVAAVVWLVSRVFAHSASWERETKLTYPRGERFFGKKRNGGGITNAHSGENWLYPPIVSSFRSIHAKTRTTGSPGMPAEIVVDDDGTAGDDGGVVASGDGVAVARVPVRLYSVEVYDASSGVLAGGELGYSVGGVYSSLTGFSEMDAAGSVQLGK